MSEHHGIFPTFFLSGFECSTFVWKEEGRRDVVAKTQHREHAREDCDFLRGLGIAVAREGVPRIGREDAAARRRPGGGSSSAAYAGVVGTM